MNLTASTLCSAPSISLKLVAPRQIVFIDRNITDYPILTAGILPGITTVLLDLDSNGIDQITQALARHQDLAAIHIISHGAPGSVQLGNGYVNLDNLAEYTDRLRSWSRSLAADAEILLYGCEVAQGGRGEALVSWLGELTQARVVAKATKTGNPELGGDWDLAASVPLAFTPAVMASYKCVLELPTITVVATKDAAETVAGATSKPGQFTLTRSGSNTAALTNIKYTLTGTATNGVDYSVTGVAEFAAGSSTMVVDLNVIDDNIFEGATPETAILTIESNPYYVYSYLRQMFELERPATYIVGTINTATVNITDNDLRPTISIADVSKVEGNSSSSNAAFTVTLSNPSTEAVTVDYTTADGTATVAGNDYTAVNSNVTFAPGSTSQVVNVPINGDILVEGDETFAVNLSNGKNATSITRSTATGTILNDDNGINVSVANPNAAEGGANGVYTLTRSGNLTNALAVAYTLSGTATTGSDYQPVTGTATFAAGAATTSVNLTVIDDTLFEGATPETVILTVTPSSNYAVGVNTGTINITDNDPRPTISINSVAIAEGNTGTSNAGFTVSLSNASTEAITVDLSTQNGTATAGSDYTALTNQLVTFAPGQTSQVVNVAVNGDLNFEANESFSGVLSNATNGSISSTAATGAGTINNDDLPTISVAVTDAEAAETLTGQPTNSGEFTFIRAGGETVEKTFLYTLSGTATNGSDYSIPGSVTFTAGSSTAKVILNPTDDNLFEGATLETAILTLIDDSYYDGSYYSTHQYDRAATYRIDPANNTGTISIADNDSRPTISIADASKAEGNTGTSNTPFTVTLRNPSIETVTVDYATANGTAASDGADYTATNNTISFAPGEISKTINVPVLGDQIDESDETYSVNLTNAVRGTIAKATGIGTILNDESGIAVSISDSDAGEANNNGQFLLTRSGELTNPVTVNYTLSGTATAGSDYQALSGSAVFAANQATASIDLTLIDDTIFEGVAPETVTLTVTPSTNYVVSSASSGTISLADNDSRPVISVSNSAIAEGNTGISKAPFTVSLSNASTETVTVKLSTADGTATTANNDYQALIDRTITFTPGQTSQVVDVDISGDLSFEANETFSAVLSTPTNGVISSTAATGIGTINNDDLPTISVAVTDAEAAETLTGQPANLGEFTFTRVGGETVEKTFLYNISGAANGSDYSIPGSVTFAAGSTTAKVILNPTDDNLFEGAIPETVILTLKDDSYNSPTNFYIASDNRPATYRVDPTNNIGTISIADNDRRPDISIADTSVTEGNTGTNNAAFTVTLSNPSTETVTVKYTAANGTATIDGNDYAASTGTVTFLPGQISQIVTVPITGDLSIEGDENFTVILSDAVSATGITRATATGTILDNDNGINVGVANPNIIEGASGVYTLTRTGDLSAAIDVAYTLSGTATSSDYQPVAGVATFAAGADTTLVNLATIDDSIFEGETAESVILTLTPSTNYLLGNSNASTINVADNDLRPVISIGNAAIAEGNTGTSNAGFTVSLSNASVETVSVNLSTTDGTATTANSDYQAVTNQAVTFAPGQTSQTINIAVNGDRDFEPDKTFTVNLTNPQNTSGITTATGTGTITNDDTLPSITVAATNPTSTEGVGEGLFTFYRTGGNLDRSLTIDFDVLGNATSRQGYGSQTGSITFAAGSNTATLPVPVANNTVYSAFRGCIIQLRGGTGYSISGGGGGGAGGSGGGAGGSGGAGGGLGGSTATVTIVDDDTAPVVSINDVSVTEGNDGTQDLIFTVSLNNASDDVVKVDYAAADGTATAGSDYLAATGTLNFTPSDIIAGTTAFTPGETSKTITVKINGDAEIESNEALTLNLTNVVGGTIGKATGTGTITNDDLPKVPVVAPEVITPAPIVPTPEVIVAPAVVIPTPIEIVQTPVVVAPEVITSAPVVPTPEVIAAPAVVIPTPVEIVPIPVVVALEVVTPAPIVPTPELVIVPDVVIPAPVLPIITIVATNPTSTEGIGEGLFTFSRTGGDLNSILTIDFDLSGNATTRQGYSTQTGSVTFAAGSNTATLGVTVADNAVYNAARGCIVTLRKGNGYDFDPTIGTAKVRIIDDEQAPVISIDDVTILEADNTKDLTFTVSLSNASDDIVTVDYGTADGTALVDCDYTATTGTLSFAPSDLIADTTAFTPGETRKTITIKIDGDAEVEETETFLLSLKNAVGGSISKATGTGTIENDDAPAIDITEIEQFPVIIEEPNPTNPVDNISPEIIEKSPVVVDPKPISPINNTKPDFISANNQLLGSSLQSIAKIIDLQSVSSNQIVQATFSVQRSAGYDNHVSFYKVEDAEGKIISQAGITFKPGDAGYVATAAQNRLTNIDLLGINGQTITSRSNVQGGAIYAPLIITNNKPDSVNLDFSNVYTAYSAANTDKIEHIRLLGDNTFGFEDTRSGGDKDFNDTIVQANFIITTNPQDLVLDVVKLTPNSTSVNLNLTDYTGQTLKADITTTSNATYSNNIGFYAVEDSIGTIKLSDGSLIKPGDTNYAVEAIKNALANSLQAGKSDIKTDLNITGGKIYAPVVVAQGTLNDFVAKNPTNGGGANDIHAYFNYLGANSDKADHFRLIGNNTFGVEDMYGGGDKDFNDLVVSLKVKAA